MGIRLDAIPITGLPQIMKTESEPELYATRVNCLLHSGQLLEHQCLEVRVNNVLQDGISEGNQTVFSWQFFNATDEVLIALHNRRMQTKHWRGCWNERDAILHTGTLPVQVAFNGKMQQVAGTTIDDISFANLDDSMPPTDAANSNGHNEHLMLESGNSTDNRKSHGDEKQIRTADVQDLLVIAEAKSSPVVTQQQTEIAPAEDYDEEVEDEEFQREQERIENEEFEEVEDEDLQEDEDVEDDGYEPSNDMEGDKSLSVQRKEPQEDEATTTPVGKRVAAFHANPVALEQTLQALKDLVANMPPKTIIVDLREHNRQSRRSLTSSALSKELLRAVFGAKYWDRGWAIKTSVQFTIGSDNPSRRLRAVIVNCNHPDGIPSLIKHYEEGYSFVLMDSRASYDESPRRTVINELRQRIPNLVVEPIG